MIEIIQNGNKTFRKVAGDVSVFGIIKPKIQKIIADMNTTLNSQNDGVAIAAPQINISPRIFIVSGKILSGNFAKGAKELGNLSKDDYSNLVFINPIIKYGRKFVRGGGVLAHIFSTRN